LHGKYGKTTIFLLQNEKWKLKPCILLIVKITTGKKGRKNKEKNTLLVRTRGNQIDLSIKSYIFLYKKVLSLVLTYSSIIRKRKTFMDLKFFN